MRGDKTLHELPIMENILELALEYGEQAEAEKITKINIVAGAFTEIVPRYAQIYFDMIAQNTKAAEAQIHISRLPAIIKCKICGTETEISVQNLLKTCSNCQSKQIELISGQQLMIDSIEIEN